MLANISPACTAGDILMKRQNSANAVAPKIQKTLTSLKTWLSNNKLSIACGFHFRHYFEAKMFEAAHCYQSCMQTQSVWITDLSDFNVCMNHLTHI